MNYESPIVQSWGNLHSFFDLFFSKDINSQIELVSGDWRVQKLKNLIDSDPARVRWNIDEVCKQLELCISGRQARRLFKACTGVGIKDYAKKRRLDAAAQALRTTDSPVKAIAMDAGYVHVRNFTRCFLKQFGLCPTKFRRVRSERAAPDDLLGDGAEQRHIQEAPVIPVG